MNFLHYEVNLSTGDIIEVTLDKQANVRVMDSGNFSRYKRGEKHSYYGGLAKQSPIRIRPPHAGHWHVVIDLGGYSGTVSASVSVVKGSNV
ncbi:DUF1883 domain-containing protein [Gimesia maris]|uniref:DUF1883 domain-containing protein n=1 Tax=Gimesia maris TaxID=122 RepID=UPI003A8DC143